MSTTAPLDEPGPVREGVELDRVALAAWLSAHGVPATESELEVSQFGRGFSNLTYSVRVASASPSEWVLRRAPPGVKIASAHDMGREHRILEALSRHWRTPAPPHSARVPRPLGLEDDESVLGTSFYVMERVRGVILRRDLPRGVSLDAEGAARLSTALVDTLVEIHSLSPRDVGLEGLGKVEGYNGRQVRGWSERYTKAQTDEVPSIAEVMAWLSSHVPTESRGALVHNDFKYDNVVLDPALGEVRAVLDWEMATLGDPLADLGVMLGYWIEPGDPAFMQALRFGPTGIEGSLDRRGVIDRYLERTGLDGRELPFFYTLALFKLAVVAQQLYVRFVKGMTTEPRYAAMGEAVRGLARAAAEVIETGRIDRQR